MLDLCTLGTGGSLPLPNRGLAACYVRVRGRGLLIDCGEGTQTAIRRLGWGFRNIDGMLLTHYHGDHCGGLPGFLLSMGKAGRKEAFHIWGGKGLKEIVSGLRVVAPVLPFPVELHEFSGAQVKAELIGLRITGFRLDHSVPCYGWRLKLPRSPVFLPERAAALGVEPRAWKRLQAGECVTGAAGTVEPEMVSGAPRKGITVLYATDTRPTPALAEYGKEADLMVLEGMYGSREKLPQAIKNRHMLFEEAAELAQKANAGKLLLTHFSNCVEDPEVYLPLARAVFPKTDAARDGLCMTLHYPEA